jgi:predicted Zn-dependent protease
MGADLEDAQKLYLSGQYTQCLTLAQQGLSERPRWEDWQVLLTETLLTLGRYPDAQVVISNAVERGYVSLRLCWLAREVFLSNGQTNEAEEMVNRILQAAANGRVGDAASLVVLARAALLKHADPKLVLDRMLNASRKRDPKSRDVYLAIGELALDKHDFALAAKTFQEGLQQLPDDPDLLQGLARAYEPSQQALMVETAEAALKRNSNHVASLVLLADHAIDAEAYDTAAGLLERVERINPWQPDAWAYRAVIASLQNEPDKAASARAKALKFWPTNPRVPHLVGRKLSQKYWFNEGAALQREALRFDAENLSAKVQLAQDLLRLGEETEGWRLAAEVQKADGYNVTANNLLSLHDVLRNFQILTNQHFVLRMTPHEAALYGTRALELLERARERLGAKYGVSFERQTLVEVFTNQADFAVRTFAMPQNDGFLGVCFGTVVTANSPGAYPGHPFNWEAMLWHEFCHVVTLNLTHNKMPRWLSEGISVYEERQANPAWGERLSPRYRQMIMGEELTPISKLSAAFLMPPSAEHLQFAYYESSLVVQFLAERFGFPKLIALLHDLGAGAEINQALAKHTLPMDALEKGFAGYAKHTAELMGPQLDWEQPEFVLSAPRSAGGRAPSNQPQAQQRPPGNEAAWEAWAAQHPTNFYALTFRAQALVREKKWPEAEPVLRRLIQLAPEVSGPQSAYPMLAAVHRALGQTDEERLVLERWSERDDAAPEAYLRLMHLSRDAKDWPAVALNARRYGAVNPLAPAPYRLQAEACEQTGDSGGAIAAYRAQLELEPADPAETHFRLAALLHRQGDPAARREVLQALEEAPRYRDALKLLLELHQGGTTAPAAASSQ